MRQIIFAILLLFPALIAGAKTVQAGIIQEYNEKAKKTPLAGVELNIRSAQSTVSDRQGWFRLEFLTLNPGEKVNVRRIEKLGYEIFNKEAVEQWNINPRNPFLIVMCKSSKFKAIRDNYERVASQSYNRQYKKEQERLAKLKKEGKLKEAEYQKKLTEITRNYDRQLDNLDNYIDKFSRIDLSELSAEEQEIIALVQQGKIDEAIKRYEDLNYLEKYRQEVEQIKEISTAIDQLEDIRKAKLQLGDSLICAIDRQIETLKLAGGRDNFNKIKTILTDLANIDTLNYGLQLKAGSYLQEQHDEEASLYLKRCEQSDSLLLRVNAMIGMSSLYLYQQKYAEALIIAESCLDLISPLDNMHANLLILSQIFVISSHSTSSLDTSENSALHKKLTITLSKINEDDYYSNIAKTYAYLAMACAALKKDSISSPERGLDYINKGIESINSACAQAESESERKMAEELSDYAESAKLSTMLEMGQNVSEKDVVNIFEQGKSKFRHNPKKYEITYRLVSQLYLKYIVCNKESYLINHLDTIIGERKEQGVKVSQILNDIDDLISFINNKEKPNLAIAVYNHLDKVIPLDEIGKESLNCYAYLHQKIAATYSNIGDTDNEIKLLQKSVSLYSKAESEQLLDSISQARYFPMALSQLGSYLISAHEYEKALPFIIKAIKYNEQSKSTTWLLYNYWDCSMCHLNLGNKVMANQFLVKIIEHEGLNLDNEEIRQVLAWAYCNLSWDEYENNNYKSALDLVNKGLEFAPQNVSLLDNKGLYLLKSGNGEEAEDILKLIESISDDATMRKTDLFREFNSQK